MMNDDQFEIGLTDLKAKFVEARKAHMGFVEAEGKYSAAVNTFLKANGVNPDESGQWVLPDLIDKVRRRSPLVLP